MAPDQSQALPIDIAYNKFVDWLVDRRKLPSDWRKKLASIHARVAVALSSLPLSLDRGFHNLTADCTGYLEAKHVRDVLLTSLPDSRSLFGRPAGAAGQWDAIVSAYEKDLIFLGEAAQILVQNTNYDIPYHKKQIAKLQQQLSDLERRESELKHSAVQSAAKYQQACQELGVPGVNVRAELLALGNTLPNIFADVVEALCGGMVGSALEYYEAFVSYGHALERDESMPVLPTLTEFRIHPPDVHCDFKQMFSNPDTQLSHKPELQSDSQPDLFSTEIDWGVETGDVETSMSTDIDWDIGTLDQVEIQDSSVPETNPQNPGQELRKERNESEILEDMQLTSEISWDIEPSAEIDWDIDVEDDGLVSTVGSMGTTDLKSGLEGTQLKEMAVGEVGPTSWFAETDNRNRLLDDIFELKAFLKQRLQEIESEETAALQNQVQAVAPSSIPHHGSESLVAMASSVARALNLLTNQKTRGLILLSTSVRYLDRLETSLIQKKQNELKLQQNIGDLSDKRVELRNSQTLLWRKQEELVARTLSVKQHAEKVLSTQFNGCKVNIIGEINTLLGQT